jgi:hypothetical protein
VAHYVGILREWYQGLSQADDSIPRTIAIARGDFRSRSERFVMSLLKSEARYHTTGKKKLAISSDRANPGGHFE